MSRPDAYVFTPEALGMFTRIVVEAWCSYKGVDGIENREDLHTLGRIGWEAVNVIVEYTEQQYAQQSGEAEKLVQSVMSDLDALPTYDPDSAAPKDIKKPRLRPEERQHEDDGA